MVPRMSSAWEKSLNLARHPNGTIRSILGYAGESIVIGRALAAGFNLFFKAWRDSPYDAVLDHEGQLYRIEIKQSSEGRNLTLTGGGRAGAQISRESESRERIVSPDDCDFLIGVHSLSGRCWIIPTEVLSIFERKSLNVDAFRDFDEAWGIFTSVPRSLGKEGLRARLRTWSLEELTDLAIELGIPLPAPDKFEFSLRAHISVSTDVDRLALAIWRELGRRGQAHWL